MIEVDYSIKVVDGDGLLIAYITDGYWSSGSYISTSEWRKVNSIWGPIYNDGGRKYETHQIIECPGKFDPTNYSIFPEDAIIRIMDVAGELHATQHRRATPRNTGLIYDTNNCILTPYDSVERRLMASGDILHMVQLMDASIIMVSTDKFWCSHGVIESMPEYMRVGDITHINYIRKERSGNHSRVTIYPPDKCGRRKVTI